MAAKLDFYSYDATTKTESLLKGTYSLGDIYVRKTRITKSYLENC